MLSVLDAFAGAGGFSLGFHQAGCRIAGAVEIDRWASETFEFNHADAKVFLTDIAATSDEAFSRFFEAREFDILIGGPPCQGFSVCVKNAGDPKDPRNSLFRDFLRLVRIFSPRLVVMENVPGLLQAVTHERRPVIEIVKEEFQKLGYHPYVRVLQATQYGVPQIRRRLFVVASQSELASPFPEPTHTAEPAMGASLFGNSDLPSCPSLWDAISDLPTLQAGEGSEEAEYDKEPTNAYQTLLRAGAARLHNHVAMKHTRRMIQRFAAMSCGESVSDVPTHLRPYRRNSNGQISEKAYDQNNRRMHPDRPCHTVPASFYANFVHPYLNRNFTAREGARIQSFPDTFVFKGKPTVVSHMLLRREGRDDERFLCQYNQIGNAVPPLLAKAVALNLISQLSQQTKGRRKCTFTATT